ncbi:MAG: hypothetical protein ACKOE2_00670, partial [Actinomycetales bacterium]
MPANLDRQHLRRLLQRHRRIVAACLAGLATLLALTVFARPPEAVAPTGQAAPTNQAGRNQVAVPLILKESAMASIAEPGDLIDVIAVRRSGSDPSQGEVAPRIVARRARVIEAADPGSGLMPLSNGVLVVAVDETTALELAEAATSADLSIAVH